jgi:hypothetical protein
MNRWIVKLVAGAMALGLTGCTFKMGVQRFADPRGDGEARSRLRIEGELASPRFLAGHLEATAAAGFVNVSRSDDTLLVYDVDDDTFERLPVSEQNIGDVRLGARLYPFAALTPPGRAGTIEPYVTGGMGYYWNQATQRAAGDELCCGDFELDEDTQTLSSGVFPYLGVGLRAHLNESWSLVAEWRQDFERLDHGFDTSGSSVMVGVRWGF